MSRARHITDGSFRILVLVIVASFGLPLDADESGRGFFGLTPRQTGEGVAVSKVTPGGPAERAGVQEGDVILLVAGKPPVVTPQGGVTQSFTRFREGDEVELVVRRDGEPRSLRIVLGPVPPLAREEQERAEAIERKIAAARVVEEMFETLDEFELTFSEENRLLFREDSEDDWRVLEPEVAATFEGVARHLMREKGLKILRLAVEREPGAEPSLVVVEARERRRSEPKPP